MAGSIANLSVRLSANINQFTTGIQAAIKPLKQLGSQVLSIGGMVNPMVGAFAGLAGAAGVGALVKGQMEAIDSTAKLSDRLGIGTEALVGLQHAANLSGVSAETLTGGFEKMLNTLADAATNGGAAANTLNKMGLNATQLANMAPDQAFAAISDGLIGIKNPADRASAAMDIFGKSGQSMLPLMLAGSEGIKAAQAEAEKLGLTFSRVDAAKVEMANDAMTKLGQVAVGVGRTLAVQLAPYITAAADALTDVATSGEGMGAKVTGAFKMVLSTIATASDYFSLLMAGFYSVRAASQACWSITIIGIGKVIEGIEWLSNKLFGTKTNYGQLVTAMGQDIAADMRESLDKAGQSLNDFSSGKNANAVEQFFTQLENNANKAGQAIANAAPKPGSFVPPVDIKALEKVSEALDKLKLDVDQFNMTDAEKKLAAFSGMKGVTPEQVKQYSVLLSQMDQLNAAKKKQDEMQQDAKSIFDATRTPMEKYESTIGHLHDLLDAGAINWDTYGRAVRDAKSELEKSAKTDVASPKAPELMMAGSAAAIRFQYDLTRGSQVMTKDQVAKQQLASQERSENYLSDLVRYARGGAAEETTEMDI